MKELHHRKGNRHDPETNSRKTGLSSHGSDSRSALYAPDSRTSFHQGANTKLLLHLARQSPHLIKIQWAFHNRRAKVGQQDFSVSTRRCCSLLHSQMTTQSESTLDSLSNRDKDGLLVVPRKAVAALCRWIEASKGRKEVLSVRQI